MYLNTVSQWQCTFQGPRSLGGGTLLKEDRRSLGMGLKVYSTFHICSLMQCDQLAPAFVLIPSLRWQTHAVTNTPYDIHHDKLCPFLSVSQNKPFFPLAAFTRSPSVCMCLHVHSHVCIPVCIWMYMYVCRAEVNLSCHLLDTVNLRFESTWQPPGRFVTAQRYSKNISNFQMSIWYKIYPQYIQGPDQHHMHYPNEDSMGLETCW